MTLEQIKNLLNTAESVNFKLENGIPVPEHFHVTEVGLVNRHFIDCGGTVRNEKAANFQLWNANDHDHRLKPEKLLKIIALSEKVLGMEDLEIEVEYQADTIGRYGLGHDGKDFVLLAKHTACLASDECGTRETKNKLALPEENTATACCTPGGGCC